MLPATLWFLIVRIAMAINDRLQRKLDYAEEERRVLREQLDAVTGGKKLSFAANQRRRLAEAGKFLTPDERQRCCLIVKPPTILAWFRRLAAQGCVADRTGDRVRSHHGGEYRGGGGHGAGAGAREEANVEAVHRGPWGLAVRLRRLQR